MRHALMAIIVSSVGAVGCPPPASLRVGYVDGTRVVRQTARGKRIRERIQVESRRLEGRLAKLQEAVKKAAAEVKALSKRRPGTDPILAKRRKDLRLARAMLRSTHLRYQKELNTFGQRLLDDLKEAIRKVATQIRRRLGLDLVIMTSRGEGLWIWPVKDITDRVMKELDSRE